MNVWVVAPYDAVDGELWGQRHAVSLCTALAESGCGVVHWAANYSHVAKVRRGEDWAESKKDGVRTIFVPVRSYSKNVSLRRILSLRDYARNLLERGKLEPSPDVIIASLPGPFLDFSSVELCHYHKVPLIVEYRDLWPEVFALPFPRLLRPLVHVALLPLYCSRNYAFRNAAAVLATCKNYLERAFRIAPQLRRTPSRVLYHSGLQLERFKELMENEEFDIELPSKVPGDIWVTYAGTLGSNYDIPALCAATKEPVLRDCGRNIRIMIAGDGPMREQLVSRINCGELTNMTYLGALSLAQVARLYAKSDIGLSIYSPGSSVVIPAKAYDMYAAALPFVNSAHGEFMEFIVAQKLGLAYQAGDPKSLSCSIAKLAVDDELRSECRRNLQRIAPAFDRKAQYSQVAEILRSIAPDAL